MTTVAPGAILEPADAACLLRAATAHGNDLGAFVRLALVVGARRGELLGLRWPDLRWPELCGDCGTLEVAGRNGGKTAQARRAVALDPRTMDVLAAWREECRAAAAGSGLGGQGYVFSASSSGQTGWSPSLVTHRVAAVAAQTDVSVGVMGLRRYSMARMPALGIAVDVAARRLGLAIPSSLRFWSAEACLAADREAALLLARELDQADGAGQGG
jgi:integrase